MELIQTRFKWSTSGNSTLSTLSIDGDAKMFSSIYEAALPVYVLEDKDRDLWNWMNLKEIMAAKVPGKTAIPYGRYPIRFVDSFKFGMLMPEIQGIKGFSKVYYHNGSFIEDSEGCPLTGHEWKLRKPEDEFMVTKSRDCFHELRLILKYTWDKKEPIFVTIQK